MRTFSPQSDIEVAAATVSLEQQIACVKRELALRRNVYAKRVSQGYMKPILADHELASMTAVLRTLLDIDTRELEALRVEVEKLRQGYAALERRCRDALGSAHAFTFPE
jgi:hypothetical protein